MVNEVSELPPIGKSDHVCQQWDTVVEEVLFKNTALVQPNWPHFKEDLQ